MVITVTPGLVERNALPTSDPFEVSRGFVYFILELEFKIILDFQQP